MYPVFDELILQAARGVNLLVKFVVIAVIVLMVCRWLFLKISPFGWASYYVRRLTDPLIWPLAQSLPMPNAMSIAPLIVVLITLLGAYFLQEMVEELRARGVTEAAIVAESFESSESVLEVVRG